MAKRLKTTEDAARALGQIADAWRNGWRGAAVPQQGRRYRGNESDSAVAAVTVYVTAKVGTAGGKYSGRLVTGACTAATTGNLAMPEGMTVAAADDTVLVLNEAENGTARQDLPLNQYYDGKLQDGLTAGGQHIVTIRWERKMFPVTVSPTGGSYGSHTDNCNWVYTVKDLGGVTLGTNMTPAVARINHTVYQTPSANSPGTGYYNAAGAFVLYDVAHERPLGLDVDILTGAAFSGNSVVFTTKSITVLSYEAGDPITLEGTDCVVP